MLTVHPSLTQGKQSFPSNFLINTGDAKTPAKLAEHSCHIHTLQVNAQGNKYDSVLNSATSAFTPGN